MIKQGTLFILGAGASKPYGYPTGIELTEEIILNFLPEYEGLLSRDQRLNTQGQHKRMSLAREFVDSFQKAHVYSIDTFLASRREYEKIGKAAITYIINKYEKKSYQQKFPDTGVDWFRYLFDKMIDGGGPGFFATENNVAFVTFNYDRSFEHLLFESYINYYGYARRITKSRPDTKNQGQANNIDLAAMQTAATAGWRTFRSNEIA